MVKAHMHRPVAWLAACLLALCSTVAMAAGIVARLDRQQVVVGETVTLELLTQDPQQSLETSLELLQDDFIVLDQRTETQMSIVNGRQTALVRLLVTLEPRRSGELQVPALRFRGGATTEPLLLKVEPAPQLAPGESPPVFIETSLDPQEGPYYVHAQLSLKVRIFYLPNLTEAAINPPAPEQASVRLLDEVPYQAERNGERYKVLERRYAIFPERSGVLTIPAMQLTGRLAERQADRLWQPSVRGRRVRYQSEPLTLDVKPRPASFQGPHWLPARSVDLAQQISDVDGLRAGEPVTRTVILDAVGLDEHMLEEPRWPEVVNARIYPDQPQGISRDDGEWVLGHREFRYAVVPEQPGELVLPEIRLHWWDTVADRERVAVLPEHRVQVLPPVQGPEASAGQLPGGDGLAQQAGAALEEGVLTRWRLLTALFAALWLITLVLYFRGGSAGRGVRDPAPAGAPPGETDLLRGLKAACAGGDASGARQLLGRWVRHHGPKEARGSLLGLAATVNQELAAALRALDTVGFSASASEQWDGTGLWRLFDAWYGSELGRGRKDGPGEFDLYAAARAVHGTGHQNRS